jgi:O-acetyl-ADP-ribose deacetylase (regulator of RNase III)
VEQRAGIHSYPLHAARQIAVATVRADLAEPGSIFEVVFACFSSDVLAAYVAKGIGDGASSSG